jgi:alpha-1,3-rhamnosyl/mannosyltransferase
MAEASVAVNLLWCVPGDVGGSEEYLVRQLLGLAELESPWRPTLFVVEGFTTAHPRLSEVFPTVSASFDGRVRPRRIAGETTWFRRRARTAALRHHGGGVAPLAAARPYVLTIHDLQYRAYPEHFSRTKRSYFDLMIGRSARGAAVIAVPSEFVRTSVIDAYGIDPERVMVVPHGVEPQLAGDVTDAATLRQRYQLGDGPVLVYPAVTHPHKNHRFLVELMAESWREPDLRLVLIGGVGSAEATVDGSQDQRIRRLGRVPAADRNGLLSLAEAMVFPSRYEGFGAPLIEAMSLRCPVIASDATCIPSIVGDAAVTLPLRGEAWADALDVVRRDRQSLIDAGLERSKRFTARASGEALAAVYTAALERP